GSEVTIGPVDLEIPAGGVTALVGPNGAGKSTLLTMIGRLLDLDEGGAPAGGNVQGDGADGDLVTVGTGDVVEGDHRRPFRRMNRRNTDPPMSSMMIVTAPSASKKFRMMK
ncbi:ATP-binding cassette domain-containing protein, partial [uncultured Corynebacterium sp.]|uniref:ATP-binding cassette domain-containing protein n=1 Tax=uncultured Corynebacterium sp. TaxID=159447 RepID=UPI00345BA819